MAEEKKFAYLAIAMPAAAVVVLLVGGFFAYQISVKEEQAGQQPQQVVCTQDAMVCPDGSYVGRTGQNCEFSACPSSTIVGQTYTNNQYGFSLQMPNSWAGYSATTETWQGTRLDNNTQLQGPQVRLRHPQWTQAQPWQDIPVMIFTKEQWQMVLAEHLAVSAAPIPPSKLGENEQYVFALPARWVGFTDAQGQAEAQSITQTFKAF